MNDNTIESIEWHKDQLAKLLNGNNDFHNVESELDSILEKVKKKVQVKGTAKVKAHTRIVETDKKDQTVGPKGRGADPAEKIKKLQKTFDMIKNIDLKDLRDPDAIVRALEILSDLEREIKELKASSREVNNLGKL